MLGSPGLHARGCSPSSSWLGPCGQHRQGILAAIEHGLSNGRLEGLNNKVRLLSHRAFGFHSAEALLALVYLCCSGIELELPSDQRFPVNPHTL